MVMTVLALLSRAGVILLLIHVDVLGVKFFIFFNRFCLVFHFFLLFLFLSLISPP